LPPPFREIERIAGDELPVALAQGDHKDLVDAEVSTMAKPVPGTGWPMTDIGRSMMRSSGCTG
jgi:hypothetical protein